MFAVPGLGERGRVGGYHRTSQWQKTCNLVTVQPDNHLEAQVKLEVTEAGSSHGRGGAERKNSEVDIYRL